MNNQGSMDHLASFDWNENRKESQLIISISVGGFLQSTERVSKPLERASERARRISEIDLRDFRVAFFSDTKLNEQHCWKRTCT